MNFQNGLTDADIGQINNDLPVKTSGDEQLSVMNIRPVRRCNYDDAFLRIKAVHFHNQRIQRLLAFIVSATEPVTSASAYCVDFVNEDEARRVLSSLFKHVANTAG